MTTTKDEIERSINELQVLCDLALRVVMSDTPIGFGPAYVTARNAMREALTEVPGTFKRLVRKAQKDHGWAASNDEAELERRAAERIRKP